MSSAVMVATVLVTVFSSNLALGVTVGVLLSGVFFTFKVARLLRVEKEVDRQAGRTSYRVSGQVFFASADMFIEAFDIQDAVGTTVLIDVTEAHFWDITAVAALDKVVQRFKLHDVPVDIIGLNQASSALIGSLDGAMEPKEA
jgi:SulP family sulfate permease